MTFNKWPPLQIERKCFFARNGGQNTKPILQRERPTQCQPRSFCGKPCYTHDVFTLQVNPSTSLCPTLSAHTEPHVTSQSSIIITHGTQSKSVFICITVTILIMSESVQSSYVGRSSQHNFQCNSLSTFKHAVHIYIVCLNSMRPTFFVCLFVCLYGSMQRRHWGQAIATKC